MLNVKHAVSSMAYSDRVSFSGTLATVAIGLAIVRSGARV